MMVTVEVGGVCVSEWGGSGGGSRLAVVVAGVGWLVGCAASVACVGYALPRHSSTRHTDSTPPARHFPSLFGSGQSCGWPGDRCDTAKECSVRLKGENVGAGLNRALAKQLLYLPYNVYKYSASALACQYD
jgi:hypothetical protein